MATQGWPTIGQVGLERAELEYMPLLPSIYVKQWFPTLVKPDVIGLQFPEAFTISYSILSGVSGSCSPRMPDLLRVGNNWCTL